MDSLPRPFSRRVLIPRSIRLVQVCNLWHERIIGVRIGKQAANAKQDLANRQRRRPLVSQNVEADAPVRVDIRVVDLGLEGHLGRLEGVVGREGDA